jgi:integrating conjugative element protein (TIGR03761 family)
MEANRLFMGRALEPEAAGVKGYGVSGGKKVGAGLRALWFLSGQNNPYADFALINASDRMLALRAALATDTASHQQVLEDMKARGLTYSVLRSAQPVQVTLGFKSPYGYSVIGLVNDFDYFVRVVKTLVRKDLLSDREGRTRIHQRTHEARSIFEEVVKWQRTLMREQLRAHSRTDFLPQADEAANKRVQFLTAILGELPRNVFNGEVRPRHSRNRLQLTKEEQRLLSEVPLVPEAAPEQAASDEAALL